MESNTRVPKWIKTTEQNSWQIELLISGGFIFVLFQLPAYVREHLFAVASYSDFGTSSVLLFVGAVILARVLLIGFVLNLLLRAIWLAFLGVHYAFPDGINYKQLDYSDRFEVLNGSNNKGLSRILKIEKYCSISYSIAIMIAVVSVGILIMLFFVFLLIEQFDFLSRVLDNPRVGVTLLFIFLLISFGALDRIYFAFFKKEPKATEAYFPVSKYFSYLNLSWVFRYEWFTLISNVSRWKIHGAVFGYFLLALFITINDLDFEGEIFDNVSVDFFDDRQFKNIPASSFYLQNSEYADLIKPGKNINVACIPSENITGNNLPLFISYKYFFDKSLEAKFLKDGVAATQDQNNFNSSIEYETNSDKLQKVLRNTFFIQVDNQTYPSPQWFFRNHPVTDQAGFFTRLDISTLRYGEHEVTVQFIGVNQEAQQDTFFLSWIPFWKE